MERSPSMNRGGSYGGGQSSLGYLFGGAAPPADDGNKQINKKNETTSPSPPPYGIDTDIDNAAIIRRKPPPAPNSPNNTFERTLAHNSPNLIITNRPSIKVRSAPGGSSSLGYLFGDNK